jgi:hypothetical protein
MDSDKFYTAEIYHKLSKEWIVYPRTWSDFIESKDLGIIDLGVLYKIVDEKKWLLAKIKYGF